MKERMTKNIKDTLRLIPMLSLMAIGYLIFKLFTDTPKLLYFQMIGVTLAIRWTYQLLTTGNIADDWQGILEMICGAGVAKCDICGDSTTEYHELEDKADGSIVVVCDRRYKKRH